jgi:hypothetical protein
MSKAADDALEENYRRFIDQVIAAKTVWALKDADGYASTESVRYPDRPVLVFWSEEAMARSAADSEFAGYAPYAIALDDFLTTWLPDMIAEGALVGPDWSAELDGAEVDPDELHEDLMDIIAGE